MSEGQHQRGAVGDGDSLHQVTLLRTKRPPFSHRSQLFFFCGLLVFCSLHFPHYNWLLFYEMVGGFFFCVCMQDSAGLPLSAILAFHSLLPSSLLPVWVLVCFDCQSTSRLLTCISFGLPQVEFFHMCMYI